MSYYAATAGMVARGRLGLGSGQRARANPAPTPTPNAPSDEIIPARESLTGASDSKMTEFRYSIPLLGGGNMNLTLRSGSSAVFVGANGSGKSRLGSYLELNTPHVAVTHRIGAQRALQIPDSIRLMDVEKANQILLYGSESSTHKSNRWQNKPVTLLMNDYSRLLVALFSDEADVNARHKRESKRDPGAEWPSTKLDKVKEIWNDAILTRLLLDKGASLHVAVPDTDQEYPADEMSDGERVLLYLVGQCVEAPPNGVIIVDEPELHLNKAILTRVWDAIESARSDCLFIYFTHDVEFAASRTGDDKFAVLSYDNGPRWEILKVASNIGLPDDVTVRILGSRKPILFVEGEWSSLDLSVFATIYDAFTVLPVGSCEQVIHLTVSYNAGNDLHHCVCRGLIDRDGRTNEEIDYLQSKRVYTMDVAEVENLFLAEAVMRQVARLMGFQEDAANECIARTKARVFELAAGGSEGASTEYAKRRLQRALSTMGFEERTCNDLATEFEEKIRSLNIREICDHRKSEIEEAVRQRDYATVLELFDQKGMN